MTNYDPPSDPYKDDNSCPICDGDVECTPTGWKCTECDWSRDYADFDREVDK